MRQILTSRLSLSKHLAHNLGNLLLLGKIGVFHNRRNASSRLLLLISKHLILCIYLVFRILARSRRLNASNLFLSLILHLGNLFLIVQLHFSKLFLILKSGVNHTSRGSISTSTLPSIKLRKCSSKIITSILSFISGRLATKSNQIKQLIRNGRNASLQRTFKKSFTSFSHSTRNKTRNGLIRVRNIRALNGRINTSITHTNISNSTKNTTRKNIIMVRNIRDLNCRFNTNINHVYTIDIDNHDNQLNATEGSFLHESKEFKHSPTSKKRRNTASNRKKHEST